MRENSIYNVEFLLCWSSLLWEFPRLCRDFSSIRISKKRSIYMKYIYIKYQKNSL